MTFLFSLEHPNRNPIRKPVSKSVRKSRMKKSLFIRARTFVKLSKEGTPFVIYAAPTSVEKTSATCIPEQYKDFEDVFLRKNAVSDNSTPLIAFSSGCKLSLTL